MAQANRQNARISAYGSEFNAENFRIQQLIRRSISTAIPVRVDRVDRPAEAGGALYVSATPLICQTAGDGTTLAPVSLPRLPFFRLQHGTAAVIVDPKVGDVGLAIFAQSDCSTLTGGNTPQGPGSFRCFDMSDGFYLGGFWGPAPMTFVRIEDTGDITITAPQTVTINTDACTVNASNSITFNSPISTFTGDVVIEKTLTTVGQITGTGGIVVSGGSGAAASISGSLTVSGGDVSADGISLKEHTHTCPDGETGSAH